MVFQVSALVSILALAQLESFYPETFQGSADGVRLLFDALLVLCSLVYLSFHYALRKPATPALYLGVAMTVVSLLLSIPSR